jgi:Cu2+-exporting ATPase/Cu+-exporting ATPase
MASEKTYLIKGMHCASCAGTIERTFKKQKGVESAEVNYGTEAVKVAFDPVKVTPEKLSKTIEPLGYSLIIPRAKEMNMSEDEHAAHLGLKQSKEEKLQELSDMKGKIVVAIPLAAFSIFVMGWEILIQFKILPAQPELIKEFVHHLLPLMATYILFVVGKPYLQGLFRFLRYGAANMDTLIGLGTSVAYLYSFIVMAFEEPLKPYLNVEAHYYDVTIVVIAFIALGKYLEMRSKLKTGDAIEKLLNLQAKTALVVRGGKEIELPIDQVVHGDLLVVKPGGRIPVDGVISEGDSYIDESMVTGEPMPVKKVIGEVVSAGTINTNRSFTFKATKVGSETLLAHIIRMVEQAQGSKAPIQAMADRISAVFVPVVLILAFLALGAWLVIGTQYMSFSLALSSGLTSFVGILVIACPCALGLATPTAIIVGVGKGAREGILIKDAATLQKLHEVTTVVVDKTGTMTKGKPELVGFKNFSEESDGEVLSILASLESKSEHPIAQAIVTHAEKKRLKLKPVQDFEAIKGKGLKGKIKAQEYFVGNAALARDLKLKFAMEDLKKETSQGKTPVLLMTKKEVLALVMVADAVKPEAVQAMKDLHEMGISVVMLTGDDHNTAEAIAREVGIDEVVAEALPESKLKKIQSLQQKGQIVAMAGDGVNDAPALAQADVGIAMGTGTDVAIETAGITLLHGDISKLVKAIRLSRMTMRGIKQNLFWAFFYNLAGIPLAGGLFYPFFGWLLSPVFAGLAMAASSVSVVGNSLRIKAKKL